MMMYLFLLISAVHGICHFAGWNRWLGWLWILLGAGFLLVAAGAWMRSFWWLKVLVVLTLLSIVSCILAGAEARIGILANLLLLALACALVRFPGEAPVISNPQLEKLWASGGHAVRLRMHGEIKLKKWLPFVAEQVLDANQGMVWAANVSMSGLPIVGSDQVIGGAGRMSWRIFDLFPVASAEGSDVSRSAEGRYLAELVSWLPGAVDAAKAGVWKEGNTIRFVRWGNPDGGAYRLWDFGVVVEKERKFGEFTVPSKIRAGWYIGSDRFEKEGEFFRATIDSAIYK